MLICSYFQRDEGVGVPPNPAVPKFLIRSRTCMHCRSVERNRSPPPSFLFPVKPDPPQPVMAVAGPSASPEAGPSRPASFQPQAASSPVSRGGSPQAGPSGVAPVSRGGSPQAGPSGVGSSVSSVSGAPSSSPVAHSMSPQPGPSSRPGPSAAREYQLTPRVTQPQHSLHPGHDRQ